MSGYNTANELIRCYDGEPWHGDSLKTILARLTPSHAAAKPIPAAHSAWEILLHIDAWNRVILRRMNGEICEEPPENFPQPAAVNDEAWRAACELCGETLQTVADRIRPLQDEDLRRPVPGTGYDLAFLTNGAVHHLIYHAGQIAVLAKS